MSGWVGAFGLAGDETAADAGAAEPSPLVGAADALTEPTAGASGLVGGALIVA